jgi:hypothetical protein
MARLVPGRPVDVAALLHSSTGSCVPQTSAWWLYTITVSVGTLADHRQYVIQLYIRVSVVLSRQHCRKEREKLDISLDSAGLWECH